ncbi:hypothetical protein [Aeoliella mucimassa]|uniref:Uncharacterized protein n=1 Tax=Aeoliella mucimassa TaxID=2527972 RepID=A0A518AS31_9BACT|nr:hypothetical protein [Aeoliella mucimassa]QDU57531.1 hypothetical protein Pan181_37490 [Aeoliella mucimassa]
MKLQGAIIEEQGVRFAIVVVKQNVVQNHTTADETIQACRPIFAGMPVILMAQDSRGTPTYYGRQDIAKFMENVPLDAVRWKEFTIG